MRKMVILLFILSASPALAIPCDCEVKLYPPTTGSYRQEFTVLAKYELEEYSTMSLRNQHDCRKVCLNQFEQDMTPHRLNALLLTYSQKLISEGLLGFNCTGLTTLKYPIRVHASLGTMGLGNVADIVQVVNHEEGCF